MTRRPIQTRFRFGSMAEPLSLAIYRNSPDHYAKGTPSPINGLRQLVSVQFQVQYPPLNGVLPTFQSPYLFTIGHQRVLSLGGWTPQIQTRFHVSGLTRVPTIDFHAFAYETITRYGQTFQTVRLASNRSSVGPTTPLDMSNGLGSSAFDRLY